MREYPRWRTPCFSFVHLVAISRKQDQIIRNCKIMNYTILKVLLNKRRTFFVAISFYINLLNSSPTGKPLMLALLHLQKTLSQNLTRILLCTNSHVLAVVYPTLAKRTDVSTRASRNILSPISRKICNHVHNGKEFQDIRT